MKHFLAIDPGMSGAVGVISEDGTTQVFDVPKLKKKNGKPDYDIGKMAEILRPFSGPDTICLIEDVHSMRGNGSVSMFGFGRGKGIWEGIAHALLMRVVMKAPQTWKKVYPDLKAESSKNLTSKDMIGKTPKERKELKAAAAKEKRLAKAGAKAKARELAAVKFPQHADRFKTVNSDGRAEALLMALYVRDILIEEMKHEEERKAAEVCGTRSVKPRRRLKGNS